MNKVLLLLFLVATNLKADNAAFFDQLSTKLRSFLATNVAASNALNEVVTTQQAVGTATVWYFYTTDKTRPTAAHYPLGATSVSIVINADQTPMDEYVDLLFELINVRHADQFREVLAKAADSKIPKSEFPREILKIEFEAMQKTKELVRKLKFSPKDVEASDELKHLFKSADTFDAFYAELKMRAKDGKHDPIKDYETQFEAYEKQYKAYKRSQSR